MSTRFAKNEGLHPEVQQNGCKSGTELLALSLREAGMGLLCADIDGNTIISGQEVLSSPVKRDWIEKFTAMVAESTLCRQGVQRVLALWNVQEIPQPCEIFTGLWLIPVPILNRRRRTGYAMAVLPTQEILFAEQLASMCSASPRNLNGRAAQAITMDYELCKNMLEDLPLAASKDVKRIASLVRALYVDHQRAADSEFTMESLGKHLAESYEELNLLLTITQNMTVQERPERFIALACKEMLATLPYEWIGLQLADHDEARSRLKVMAGRMIVAGQPKQPVSTLRSIAKQLLETLNPRSPLVLLPGANVKHAEYEALGNTVLVHPVSSPRDGHSIGLLVAGGKRGTDPAASNTDIKLMGAMATHVSIFLENAALYEDLSAMFLGTLEALTASIDAKDPYTCGHSRRVAHLTQLLAQTIGLDDHIVSRCRIAGLVHDVGKIGVPEQVLTKPGRLTDEEFGWIRKHPEIGYRILKDIPQFTDILPGVLYHHERWDGKGYPAGLKGEEIPLVARLIGLADSFDAMSSTRTYRSALSREQVLEEIRRCIGTQFDPALGEPFLSLDFTQYDAMAKEHSAAADAASASSSGGAGIPQLRSSAVAADIRVRKEAA